MLRKELSFKQGVVRKLIKRKIDRKEAAGGRKTPQSWTV
jgi:hypothetical protein